MGTSSTCHTEWMAFTQDTVALVGAQAEAWVRLGLQIDRLVTVEMRPASGSVPAGLVEPVYNAARTLSNGPLSTSAAEHFVSLPPGTHVLIATGAGVTPDLPAGETDGPPGAAVLAAVLRDALGLAPRFVTEPAHAPAVRACAELLGFDHDEDIELLSSTDVADATLTADELLEKLRPSSMVFIERDGANPEGRYHGVRGNCRPLNSVARIDELETRARARGIPVVAVGDGGNEVGFGTIRDQVNSLYPGGGSCMSDCTSGRATASSADFLVSSAVSNWGAYGVALAIASRAGDLDAFPSPALEQQLISACVDAGALDGAIGKAALSVDGISFSASQGLLELLVEMGRIFSS